VCSLARVGRDSARLKAEFVYTNIRDISYRAIRDMPTAPRAPVLWRPGAFVGVGVPGTFAPISEAR